MDELVKLRQEIDKIDSKLLELISKRLLVVKKVGEYKNRIGRPVKDPKREEERITILAIQGKKYGLARNIIEKIWKTFFEIAYIIEKDKNE